MPNLLKKGEVFWREFHGARTQARANRSTRLSVCQCKGVLPIIPEDEVSFAKSAAGHDLNGVGTTGICLNDSHELFIGRSLHAQSVHESSCCLETNRQTRATMAVEFDTFLEMPVW